MRYIALEVHDSVDLVMLTEHIEDAFGSLVDWKQVALDGCDFEDVEKVVA